MIALGGGSWRRSTGPILTGRTYTDRQPGDNRMSTKIAKLWEGLTATGLSGTYIRPHAGGYAFGRWWNNPWGYRFEHLGERSTVEACREALAGLDKSLERKAEKLRRARRQSRGQQ